MSTTGLALNMASALNTTFVNRATWTITHDVTQDALRVGFQCTKRTPEFLITEATLEDGISGAMLLADRCVETYERHHRLVVRGAIWPILTCPACRHPVDVPPEERQQGYEFCIEQAEAWMKRAAEARPVGSW